MLKNKQNITIVGAGLAGVYAAILFAKEGFKVNVFEKLSEKDTIDANSKRSYNLTFYKFAETLFKKQNIWDQIIPYTIRLDGAVTTIGKINGRKASSLMNSFIQRLRSLNAMRRLLLKLLTD